MGRHFEVAAWLVLDFSQSLVHVAGDPHSDLLESPENALFKNRKMKALIVDDHPDGRYFLEALLRAHGWTVAVAEDGVAALEQLRGGDFDLVVSDLLMPHMDGLRLRHEMMQADKLRDIPFVLYTANLDRYVDEGALASTMGRTLMVPKPIEPDVMMRKIDELLARSASGAPIPPVINEQVFLKQYSEKLVHRLEESNLQLDQANRALQEGAARFRDFAESTSDWFWEMDAGLRFKFLSEHAFRQLGLPVPDMRDPAVTKDNLDQHRLLLSTKWISQCPELKQHRPFRNFEYRLATGEVFHVSGKPVVNAAGLFQGYRGVGNDVTAELQTKAALAESEQRYRQLSAELEQRVARRTAQLSAAKEELESFAYSIAHDLRAPLITMTGFSQFLLGGCTEKLPTSAKHALQRVAVAGKTMSDMIDGLLELAKIGRGAMCLEPVDVSALAQDVWAYLTEHPCGHRIEFQVQPGLTAVADKVLLRNVLQNLLSNAIKFSREADPARIEFGASHTEHGLAFHVRDNGAGFDMRYADKLFITFQRLHSPGEFEGTGVGLSTVARIITYHGGRVWAQSEPGQGATFWFTLGANAP